MQARLWMIVLGLWVGVATFGAVPTRAEQTVENGVNRPGGDYKNFDLEPTVAGFAPCQSACTHDPSCRAWTYVVAGVQGPKPHCWLKNTVPPASKDKCCVSGVSGVVAGLEFGTNRPGSDYRNFEISNADLRDQAELLCKKACDSEDQCKSWTYVKPGIQGPNARCWLKSATPGAQANNCCISGVRPVKPIKTGSGGGTGGLDLDPNGKSIQQCQEAFARNRAVCDRTGNPVVISSCYQQIQAAQGACVSLAASKAGGTTGGGTTTASVPPEWAEMLKAHNEKRALHGSPALSWDAGLAAGAQSWAAACTRQHSGFDKGYGENLYWGTNQTARDAVEWWYAENNNYRWDDTIKSYHAGDTDPSKEVRHFTQLVWKETSKLGCGVATCQNQQYFVCRYLKQGNWNADTPGVLEANVPPKK